MYILCCCFFPCIITEMTISISCKRFTKNKWMNEQCMIQKGRSTLSSTDRHNQPICTAFTAPCWLHSRARNQGYVTCVASIPTAGRNSTSGSCSCRNSTAVRKRWRWNITHTLHYFVRCNSQFLEHKQLCSTLQILPCHT